MDLERARRFAAKHHRAVLVTHRRAGGVQTSPVLCATEEAGTVVVSTRETAVKTRNVRHDPRVTLCVVSDDFFGDWVQLDGLAGIVSLPEAMEGLVEYYRLVAGEHPDWDEYRAAMEREGRVLLRIMLERAGPEHAG